jgi:hypothetical protein
MMTQLSCSPCTSTPCQNEEVAKERNSAWHEILREARSSERRPEGAWGTSDFSEQALMDLAHLGVAVNRHEGAAARYSNSLRNPFRSL